MALKAKVGFIVAAMLFKGASISLVLYLLDITFWKQIVVASVSATLTGVITGVFAVWIAHLTRENRTHIDRVSQQVEDAKEEVKDTVVKTASNGNRS